MFCYQEILLGKCGVRSAEWGMENMKTYQLPGTSYELRVTSYSLKKSHSRQTKEKQNQHRRTRSPLVIQR